MPRNPVPCGTDRRDGGAAAPTHDPPGYQSLQVATVLHPLPPSALFQAATKPADSSPRGPAQGRAARAGGPSAPTHHNPVPERCVLPPVPPIPARSSANNLFPRRIQIVDDSSAKAHPFRAAEARGGGNMGWCGRCVLLLLPHLLSSLPPPPTPSPPHPPPRLPRPHLLPSLPPWGCSPLPWPCQCLLVPSSGTPVQLATPWRGGAHQLRRHHRRLPPPTRHTGWCRRPPPPAGLGERGIF